MSIPPPSRALILCADDYALHPLVDDAVQQLARAGRLSATSCMTTAPRWREAARALQPLRHQLSVGLHFNLTEGHGRAYAAQDLGRVLRQTSMRGAGRRRSCATPGASSWTLLSGPWAVRPTSSTATSMCTSCPACAMHCLAEWQARYAGQAAPWVRSTSPAPGQWRNSKALVIALLGGWMATHRWRRAGVTLNRGFAGVYGFDALDVQQYGAHMQGWLAQAQGGGLVMCHPASAEVPGDAIGRQRPVECAYLMSPAFGALLERSGMHVHQGRWPVASSG